MSIYDVHWNACTVALEFNGADGSQAIVDTKGNTVTVVGEAALSTAWSAAGGSSLYLSDNFTGPHLRLTAAAAFNALGVGLYTIDLWFRPDAGQVPGGALLDLRDTEGAGFGLYLQNGTLVFDSGYGAYLEHPGIVAGQAYHVAVEFDGVNHLLFVDGFERDSYAGSSDMTAVGADLYIGTHSNETGGYKGEIDQLYLVPEVALYAGDFTPLAPTFDGIAPPEPTLVGTGTASFAGVISVVEPLVFDSSAGYVKWYATVMIGAVDISARLSGPLRIAGAEDSARLASLSVTPLDAAELAGYDSAPVTIDVTLFRTGQQATYRRFTGRVEGIRFSPADRLAAIDCRDGWQERPAACTTAAQVEALFAGLATPCPPIVAWNAVEPDPAGYFRGLLDTLRGATAIDASGVWQAVPWTIGAPAASFAAGEIFDGSVELIRPNRADVPSAIVATLSHRYPRLHSAEKVLTWEAVERVRYVVDGLPTAPKSMVAAALAGASGWLIKGPPSLIEPTPGSYPVIAGPQTVYYIVSYEVAAITCESMTATLYRRWYQQAEVRYSISIDMGGASERDDSISLGIESTFDAGAWENGPSAEADTGIYQANAPTPTETPTGYEGLPAPWPPGNGALDHHADIDADTLQAAARHVVARALRKAAQGKRRQAVRFARPFDPRWEIGAVLAVDAYGLAATGQVTEFDEQLDHDSGDAVSTFSLACPAGTAGATEFTASVTPPAVTIGHALAMPLLSNHIGAAFETPAIPDEDQLLGFLCNVQPTSDNYDASKPVYEPQFRIIMPEIPEAVRDPLTIEATITATVNISGSGVEVTF